MGMLLFLPLQAYVFPAELYSINHAQYTVEFIASDEIFSTVVDDMVPVTQVLLTCEYFHKQYQGYLFKSDFDCCDKNTMRLYYQPPSGDNEEDVFYFDVIKEWEYDSDEESDADEIDDEIYSKLKINL